MKKGLTMMESLIIITLIIVLLALIIFQLNPKNQINKAKDSRRKTDLTMLKKVLEDWYNDKNCYPKPEEICYDAQSNSLTCHICGEKPTSPNFQPYFNKLPCDPDSQSNKNYLYEVDNNDCPSLYRIYTKLEYLADQEIAKSGCPESPLNYGVSSPNTGLQCQLTPTSQPTSPYQSPTPSPTQSPSNIYCRDYNPIYIISLGICNICGSYNECLNQYPEKTFYIDFQCQQSCIKN